MQIKFAYLENFVDIFEKHSSSLVFFEAEDSKHIESLPEDLWQIDVFFEQMPDVKLIEAEIESECNKISQVLPMLKLERVIDKDWVSEVQKTFIPINSGKFFIHPTSYVEAIPKDQIRIEINAGRAFGTGEHETTSNCLQAISYIADSFKISNCLDMGTGSGILAVGMKKLFNAKVTAVDIDEQAVAVASENAMLNEVDGIMFGLSDGYKSDLVSLNGPYELICANILAGPLISMAKDATKYLADKAFLILAGFIEEQFDEVLKAHQDLGLNVYKIIKAENWPVLILQCKA